MGQVYLHLTLLEVFTPLLLVICTLHPKRTLDTFHIWEVSNFCSRVNNRHRECQDSCKLSYLYWTGQTDLKWYLHLSIVLNVWIIEGLIKHPGYGGTSSNFQYLGSARKKNLDPIRYKVLWKLGVIWIENQGENLYKMLKIC